MNPPIMQPESCFPYVLLDKEADLILLLELAKLNHILFYKSYLHPQIIKDANEVDCRVKKRFTICGLDNTSLPGLNINFW